MIGRILYLITVLAGLVINADEYRQARWVSRSLVDKKINGIRQIVARHLSNASGMLLTIQALLIVPAIASFIVPRRDLHGLDDLDVTALTLALFAHIAMVLLLTRLAFLNRRHREQLVAAAEADDHAHD